MTRQCIYLDEWDWMLTVYYSATEEDAEEILQTLQGIGCSRSTLRKAEDNLSSGLQDTGLTYTNDAAHSTVMVIGESSSPDEFWDTADHEKGHAVQHISEALGLDCRGEEQQYIAGSIAKEMHPMLIRYI